MKSKLKSLEEQQLLSDLHGQVVCALCDRPAVDCIYAGNIASAYCEQHEFEVFEQLLLFGTSSIKEPKGLLRA